MNAKLFKQLIKEAVREAVREEVGIILLEQKKQHINENQSFNTIPSINYTTNEVDKVGLRSSLKNKMNEMFGDPIENNVSPSISTINGGNPFASFLEESAHTMTPQELSGLRNLG